MSGMGAGADAPQRVGTRLAAAGCGTLVAAAFTSLGHRAGAFVAPAGAKGSSLRGGAAATTSSGLALAARTAVDTGAARAGPCALGCGLAVGVLPVAAALVVRRSRRGGRARERSGLRVATIDQPVQKANLSDTLPDCPSTIWKADNIDIANLPEVQETAPLIIDATELGDALQAGKELEYFTTQRENIMEQLQKHGAIWFRNFDTMKDAAGFRSFYECLQLNPCLDPIHTSGLRDMVEKKDAVYEAVNKPSLAQHFVGLHNESTFVKTAMFGAFVCFSPASEGGGEFIVADGAKIIKDLDPEVLKRIYERKVRISVSNLDLNFIDAFPEGFKEGVQDYFQDLILKVVAPKFDMDLEMIYGADGTNPYRLQAIEHAQSPINTHPVTGQPVWFCNLHNHSRYLRDRRNCTVPEVGMTDVYHGDLGRISPEDVRHINEVCEKNIVSMLMEPGDVMLLDNYRVLHGRKIFKGERKHAVTWFESCGEPLKRDAKGDRPDDFMNNLINKTLV